MPPKPVVRRDAKEEVVVVDDAGNRLAAPSQKKFDDAVNEVDAKIAALKTRKVRVLSERLVGLLTVCHAVGA